jgi:uncharacterized membrane protein required for colicin V production
MDLLQRLQPLDVLFAIAWAGIVGWGLQAGIVRQLGMLVGVYGAALLSGSVYRSGGSALALAFGRELQPQLEFAAYLAIFLLVFGLIGALIWRAYPATRFGRRFGIDNVVGAGLGGVWGLLLLIAVLTVLRFYAAVPWKAEEASQQGVARQVQLSQVAPVLEVVASPLWDAMAPWFPAPVPNHL